MSLAGETQVRIDGVLQETDYMVLEVVPKNCQDPHKEPDSEGVCHCRGGFVLGHDGGCLTPDEASARLARWAILLSGTLPTAGFIALVVLLVVAARRLRRSAVPPLKYLPQSALAFLPAEVSEDEDTHAPGMQVAQGPGKARQQGDAGVVSSLVVEAAAVEAGDSHSNGAAAVAAALPRSFWSLAHVSMQGRQVAVCPPLLYRDQRGSPDPTQSALLALAGPFSESRQLHAWATQQSRRYSNSSDAGGADPVALALALMPHHHEQQQQQPGGANGHSAVIIDPPAKGAKVPEPRRSSVRNGNGNVSSNVAAFRGRGRWAQYKFDWRSTNVADLNRARNERVLHLLGVCTLDAGLRLLVYEFSPLGSLEHLLQEEALVDLSVREHARMAEDVLLGCKFLHSVNVVASLSAHTVFVGSSFACKIRPELSDDSVTINREHTWSAPEVLDGDPPSKASDVYAFGIILVEIFTGRPAFRKKQSEMVRGLFRSGGGGPRESLSCAKHNTYPRALDSCACVPPPPSR